MKRVAVITGSRSELGLLKPLVKELANSSQIDLTVIITGAHLINAQEVQSSLRDLGVNEIKSVQCYPDNDDRISLVKSLGQALEKWPQVLLESKIDAIVVLGDRTEIWPPSLASHIMQIPIFHIHGGELTLGAIDDGIRHSISKLAAVHFAATDEFRMRLIQMGESPERVFNFGAPGLDNITTVKRLTKDEFESATGYRFAKENYICTYHPATGVNENSESTFQNIVDEVLLRAGSHILITHPNPDPGFQKIVQLIEVYKQKFPERVFVSKSLGIEKYYNAMFLMDAMIGNSSSAYHEAPTLHMPSIDVGMRQDGRPLSDSIVRCGTESTQIRSALAKIWEPDFLKSIKHQIPAYGHAGASTKIKKVIESIDLKSLLPKKFYDLKGIQL